jgi:hypothetical protein
MKLVLALAVLLPTSALAAGLRIEARIDDGPWVGSSIAPTQGATVTLRVPRIADAKVRWYRIVPDTSRIYKNANHPWEPNPYQWVGFDEIGYERVEIEALRGQWEVTPLPEIAAGSPSHRGEHLDVSGLGPDARRRGSSSRSSLG